MTLRRSRPTVRITGLAVSDEGGTHRVSALVDGEAVWFESADTALRAAPEAFGSAFLIPALHRGARLEFDVALDPTWLANMSHLVGTFRDWWGTPALVPAAPAPPAAGLAARDAAPVGAGGLCFSGGVDSFHSLLRSGQTIDRLVAIQGLDIPVDDALRMAALTETLRDVSARRAVPFSVVRTNVRSHPLMRAAVWERTHGGALVSVGHALDATIGRLMISSSIPFRSRRESWGSHWQTDAYWSSSRLTVMNIGAEYRRRDKLRAIVNEPLVRRHLRVCWENRTSSGNCSRCEKCLTVMLLLAECGALEGCPVFEGAGDLPARIDALPRIRNSRTVFRDLARSDALAPDVLRAVRAVVRRTERTETFRANTRRFLERTLRPLARRSDP